MQKGQIQIVIIGIVVIGAFLILNFTGVLSGKKGSSEEEGNSSPNGSAVSSEETDFGPKRSNFYPTGALAAGTNETEISISTDVPAYCRYSREPGKDYSSMTGSFNYDKEKTFHKIKVVGLDNGQTYNYYVRCRDMSGTKNTEDALISFSVGSSNPYSSSGGSSSGYTLPSTSTDIPPRIISFYPTGTLPAGTSEIQMTVDIDEPGYCRYSTTPGVEYNSMSKSFSYDKEKLTHTIKLVGLEDNKVYEYYVRCRDTAGNRDTSDTVVRFGIGGVAFDPSSPSSGQETNPPYRYDGYPDDDMPYSTKTAVIGLKTDETAICKYSDVSGMSYGQMKLFANTNSLSHSTEVYGLSEGQDYDFYVKCADLKGNQNTDDYLISFLVEYPEDVTPPVRTSLYPDRDLYYGTTQTQLSVQTNEPASCRYSTEQGVEYKSMKKKFTSTAGNIHVATVTGLENGIYYTFFVRCQDEEGNANTGDVMIRFRVTP